MDLPENALRKGIQNPTAAARWVWDQRPNTDEYFERVVSRVRGRRLFDSEWDCAIVLDACRYDLASNDETARRILGAPEPVYSLGANSKRWIKRTFESARETQRSQTHYVTANIFSDEFVPDDVEMTELWRTQFDERLSTVPPDAVTAAAIQIGRAQSPRRLVVHYMQPHLPPTEKTLELGLDLDFRGGWNQDNPWRRIEAGDVDGDVVERAYRANLAPVVESVEELLNNLDADTVVVTADHGNFLGEGGRWGHHWPSSTHPAVRRVPWWETSATDRQTHDPTEENVPDNALSRDEKLEALGYL